MGIKAHILSMQIRKGESRICLEFVLNKRLIKYSGSDGQTQAISTVSHYLDCMRRGH